MQISCISSMFYNKNFIFKRIQYLNFSQKVLSTSEVMFPPTDGRGRAFYGVYGISSVGYIRIVT